jgi:drug/metabolite transporter (DMT)-like permease
VALSLALLGVAGAALCSGAAIVVQAQAVRSEPAGAGLDPTLLLRLVRRPAYLLALALVAAGFGLSFVALRTLPLFVVQAGRASSLAVTAVLAMVALRARLSRVEIGAVLLVVGGMMLLAFGSGAHPSDVVSTGTRVRLLVAVFAIAAAAAAATRIGPETRSGLFLSVFAGLSFAILALGARILRSFAPAVVVLDPAAWAMAFGGVLGLLLTAMALQRTSVVGATARMVGTETIAGAALGMVLSGDRPAPGGTAVSILGFACVLAGALSLTRFAAPERLATIR